MLSPVEATEKTSQPAKVSVVMVVRNVETFLPEAIESILNQTFKDFEFVILDFGSTDQTKAIVSSYAARDGRIRLREVPTCGLAEARNAVASLAKGQYIAIQDADDVSLPDRLRWQVGFMNEHPEVGVVGGAAEWINAQGQHLWVMNMPTEDREIRSALVTRCPFMQTAVLMRREAFESVGKYRSAFAPAEDYDLWLRMSEWFRCANLEPVVVKYRIHPQQVSISKRKIQTLCIVAARTSARLRKAGSPDLFDSEKAITPELLARLNVSDAEVEAELFSNYRDWIHNMASAKERSTALEIAGEVLRTEWEHIQTRDIARLHLKVARLNWQEKRYVESLLAVCHTVQLALGEFALAAHFGRALLRRVWKVPRAICL